MNYASGIEYQACPVTCSLYFPDTQCNVLIDSKIPLNTSFVMEISPVPIAQIQEASGGSINNWQNDVNDGTAPLYSNFYGDFGVALKSVSSSTDPSAPTLSSVLTQAKAIAVDIAKTIIHFPSFSLSNGYIITVGNRPVDNKTTIAPGTLQLGLIEANIINDSSWNSVPFSTSQDGSFVLLGTLSLKATAETPENFLQYLPYSTQIPILLDTGTPSTHLWTGNNLPQDKLNDLASSPDSKLLASNIQLELTFQDAKDETVTLMSFITGEQSGLNQVTFTPPEHNDPAYLGLVNTGLQAFFGQQVMFDFSTASSPCLRFKPINS